MRRHKTSLNWITRTGRFGEALRQHWQDRNPRQRDDKRAVTFAMDEIALPYPQAVNCDQLCKTDSQSHEKHLSSAHNILSPLCRVVLISSQLFKSKRSVDSRVIGGTWQKRRLGCCNHTLTQHRGQSCLRPASSRHREFGLVGTIVPNSCRFHA